MATTSASELYAAFDATKASLMTVILSIILSDRLKQCLGIPPICVIVRRTRPYFIGLLFLVWFSGRIISFSVEEDSPDRPVGEERGLLTFLVNLITELCEYLPWQASIILNDTLGMLFLHSLWKQTIEPVMRTSVQEMKQSLSYKTFFFCKTWIPAIRQKLSEEEEKMRLDIEQSLKDPTRERRCTLPDEGVDTSTLLEKLRALSSEENDRYAKGLISGAVYSGEKDHTSFLNAVYGLYTWSNPLHVDIWPSVNQMEAEICAMTASLLNGGDSQVVGSLTSGGTESIFLAVKASLQYYGTARGVTHPEIVACTTAHAGLDKACQILNIRLIKIPPCSSRHQLPPSLVQKSISSNTIMIYASAPNFPHGVVDDIPSLSQIAETYDIGLHVDACLGGYVLPFADAPPFDFVCSGVTSMSCDTHKYGFATKGTSVVLYRHFRLRRCQYFTFAKWSGGLYITPTLAGSRSGALIACTWASLMSMGIQGYTSRIHTILDTAKQISKIIDNISTLKLISSQFMIVSFGSDAVDIYGVGDAMTKLGWSLNSLQDPPSLHICVTVLTCQDGVVDTFERDLRASVEQVLSKDRGAKKEGNAAIYGMAGTMPSGPVEELLKCYTDVMLTA